MAHDSAESRRAAEFDDYRRDLLRHAKPVSAGQREAWFERFQGCVEAQFIGKPIRFSKPGAPNRLFFAEVELAFENAYVLMEKLAELEDAWRVNVKDSVTGGASVHYMDRRDAVWEFALDLGEGFHVCAAVKLRSFPFEKSKPRADEDSAGPAFGGPPAHGGNRGRKPVYDDRDRGRKDRKPWEQDRKKRW